MEANEKKKSFIARRWWLIPVAILVILAVVFFSYVSVYYHADEVAESAMLSSAEVIVKEKAYGYLFDGPNEDAALIFYPGGKVEETAYAPLLHDIAAAGVDVCLVKMPFRLAVFGVNKADQVVAEENYSAYYLAGHSLGGAMAASYASSAESIAGLILLAAYPTKELPASLAVLSLVGSEDSVLDRAKAEAGKSYVRGSYTQKVIEGGNHAFFGSYGEQKGDGVAYITAAEQRKKTVDAIVDFIRGGEDDPLS